MNTRLSFIFVGAKSRWTKDELLNAFHLCTSISESPTLVWQSSERIPDELLELLDTEESIKICIDHEVGIGHKVQDIFDQISLSSDILIVCAGDTSPINNYLHARLKDKPEKTIQWNIISAKYARFSFMEQQRTLSEFLPLDTQTSIRRLLSKYGSAVIVSAVDSVNKATVSVVGEIIFDEYIFCDALGKVSKDPLVAFAKRESQLQLGGSLATARHFAGLGCKTEVISETDAIYRHVIESELVAYPNVSLNVVYESLGIKKTRFVDRASNARVFETYELPIEYSNETFKTHLNSSLLKKTIQDQIVLMDYGHGLMDSQVIDLLLNKSLRLIVNTQSNAANRGFNTVSRYKGVHSIFLNGSEVLLEARSKESELAVLIPVIGADLDIEEFFVTNGSRGIYAWTKKEGLYESPAFAPLIVDRVGAGDASLATVAAMRSVDIPIDIALFFGNIAGAILVSSVGNEISVSTERLRKEANLILEKVESAK